MSTIRQNISIILPIFISKPSDRVVTLLAEAIDSTVRQKYPSEYEILLVDDGSSVPVKELLSNSVYQSNKNIRWFRFAMNKGLVYALNYALNKARYDYIARIDADDKWGDGKIEKQMQMFSNDLELSLVATGMKVVYENGAPPMDHIRAGHWEGILDFTVSVGCPFPHGSVVALKSVYRLLTGYNHDPKYSHCEDYALWVDWLRFFKPAMIEEVLYYYLVSKNAVSSIHTKQQQSASSIVVQKFSKLQHRRLFPNALRDLAFELGISVIEAGKISYLLWKYCLPVKIPKNAVRPLSILLEDRRAISVDSVIFEKIKMFHELLGKVENRVGNCKDYVAVVFAK